MNYFFDVSNSIKYPNIVDNNDPANTPILTPSMYCIFSTNAKFPTNKLIVKPIPVKIDTPYKLSQLDYQAFVRSQFSLQHRKRS